jgi:hypothetical protein
METYFCSACLMNRNKPHSFLSEATKTKSLKLCEKIPLGKSSKQNLSMILPFTYLSFAGLSL